LTNIYKYAQVTEVKIQAIASSDCVRLCIEDNGKGFELGTANTGGFRLQGMQERIAALKGNFSLDTKLGYGCRIAVEIPLQESL
jgi:signal transduction histidine kinase